MKQKIYTSKSRGYCGPCSFINMIGLKGSFKLEKQLSSIGRLKPFLISDWTSFFIWAEKYKKNIKVYLTSKKLNNKTFKLMQKYEKIPDSKIKEYTRRAIERHKKLIKKFGDRAIIIKNPIKKLNSLLNNGYKVAILFSDYYIKRDRKPVPHSIVAFKRKKGKYYFMDSIGGLLVLTRKQVLKGWEINKKQGFNIRLIAYKNTRKS